MVHMTTQVAEFIAFAEKKSKEFGVEHLCEFKVEDINVSVETEKYYDVVILGAVGDVLGNPKETMEKLKKTVKPGGFIIIDDAYSKESSNQGYYTKEEWYSFFDQAGVKLIEEVFIKEEDLMDLNNEQQGFIVKRANELKERYPEKASLFDGYIKSQLDECDDLENDLAGVTLLLKT